MKQSLEEQAREMSTTGLRDALSWSEALAEHADEIGSGSDYNKSQEKIKVIRAELDKRRIYG